MKNYLLLISILLIAGCGSRMKRQHIEEEIVQDQIWLDSLFMADTEFDSDEMITQITEEETNQHQIRLDSLSQADTITDTTHIEKEEETHPYQMWLDSLPKADSIFDSEKCGKVFPYNDDGIYRIIYRNPINGYHVKGILHHLQFAYGICEAILYFNRQDERFTIIHPYFELTSQQIDKIISDLRGEQQSLFTINGKELGFYLDYTIDKADTAFLKSSVPFFFQDVDFDRKKELVLRFPHEGQGRTHLYQVWEPECGISLKCREPYNDFDETTRFDTRKREIIIYYHGGVDFWTRKYYRLKNGEMTLYKMIKSRDTISHYRCVISTYERRGDEMILTDTKKIEHDK